MEQYELKSKNGKIGHKIANGAYDTFVQRITDKTSPDFVFMSYDTGDMMVHQLYFAIVKDTQEVDRQLVRKSVKRAFGMRIDNLESRGWLFDVLHCINGITSTEFTLSQIYQFEKVPEMKYPSNHNIRPKIRQQLQVLRDRGIIEFLGNGNYRKV